VSGNLCSDLDQTASTASSRVAFRIATVVTLIRVQGVTLGLEQGPWLVAGATLLL